MLLSLRASAAVLALATGSFFAFPPDKTTTGYSIHTAETAPAATKPVFANYEKSFGFVPNLARVMAEAPPLLLAYKTTQDLLMEHSTLTPAERNVVQLAIAFENHCKYCVAGHTMIGQSFWQTPEQAMAAIRAQQPIENKKLQALREFASQVYEHHGHVGEQALQAFLAAGYTRKQSLEVVANIAAKVMSNYTNGLAATPLDEPMKPFSDGIEFAK